MDDGIIKLGSIEANSLGFTSDIFSGYLWKIDNTIIISLLISLQTGKGNVLKLFQNIRSKGFEIQVPTPSARMEMICQKFGMTPANFGDGYYGYTTNK